MDFTEWFQSLKSVAEVLAGFGLVTVLLAYGKLISERRNWEDYKRRVEKWVEDLIVAHDRHPHDLTEAQWRFEVERMLTEANFGPMQIQQLLETAVIIAKGSVSEKLIW